MEGSRESRKMKKCKWHFLHFPRRSVKSEHSAFQAVERKTLPMRCAHRPVGSGRSCRLLPPGHHGDALSTAIMSMAIPRSAKPVPCTMALLAEGGRFGS